VRTRMPGGVRGRGLAAPFYSIYEQEFPESGARHQTFGMDGVLRLPLDMGIFGLCSTTA